jgi:hypothetical protein
LSKSDDQTSSISESVSDRKPPVTDTIEQRDIKREIEVEHVCDVCGKAFESEGSLKAHKLRSHRISPHPAKRPLEEERGEVKIPVSKLPPTLREDAYIKSVEEEIVRLKRENQLLSEELNRLRLLQRRQSYMEDYGWSNRRPRYEIDVEEDELLKLRRARLYEAERKRIEAETRAIEQPPQHDNPQITALQSSIEGLQTEVKLLRDENKELREKLAESERKRLEDTIRELRDDIKELKTGQNRLSTQYDLGIETIRAVKEIVVKGMTPVETRRRRQLEEDKESIPDVDELLPPELVEES